MIIIHSKFQNQWLIFTQNVRINWVLFWLIYFYIKRVNQIKGCKVSVIFVTYFSFLRNPKKQAHTMCQSLVEDSTSITSGQIFNQINFGNYAKLQWFFKPYTWKMRFCTLICLCFTKLTLSNFCHFQFPLIPISSNTYFGHEKMTMTEPNRFCNVAFNWFGHENPVLRIFFKLMLS